MTRPYRRVNLDFLWFDHGRVDVQKTEQIEGNYRISSVIKEEKVVIY